MADNEEILKQLKHIFELFLHENIPITSNVSLDKLITHLSAKENDYILQNLFVVEWLDKCLTKLENNFKSVHLKIVAFMLNFCSILYQNEWIIISMRQIKTFERLFNILQIDCDHFTPSIKLGYVRVLASISKMSLGLSYIHRHPEAYLYLIKLCSCDHTLYVVREARQLLYELLYKFAIKAKNEKTILEIFEKIMEPIHENVYKEENHEQITINVDDGELQHRLSSTLDLLSYFCEKTVEATENAKLICLLQTHHKLKLTVWKLVEMTQNTYFLEKILQTLTTLNFALLVEQEFHPNGSTIEPEKFTCFGLNFLNTMKCLVTRQKLVNFIKLAELNHKMWKKLGSRAPAEIKIENVQIKFENQLITFHLLPLLFIMRNSIFFEEDLYDNYIMQLFDINCEHTLRICYAVRDQIYSMGESALGLVADLAYKSIHSILSMETMLKREQAILVFQALIYALKEFVGSSKSSKHKKKCTSLKLWMSTEFALAIPNVLYATLIGVQSLIQRYHINWKESIESICLVNIVAYVLENPHLTDKLVVQALKLAQLAIEHFLSPNMALLVDDLHGSGLVCLGPIIVKRLHDISWEVRDSALELTTSITDISFLKFPAFQQFLHQHKLSSIVFDVVRHDNEAYVRASAFKCIAKMILINNIWENDMNKSDLFDHIFFVLLNDSESLVRKEALKTLAIIYDNRNIPSTYLSILYSSLSHCILDDLNWEVKIEGLHFWELEFQKQLTYQGMIDGTFPPVTFSKENKKIVTLTEKEIQLRIMKVFRELSQKGCLGIILQCLRDECDLEVLRTAVDLVHQLLEKLKKYDYETIINNMDDNFTNNQTNVKMDSNKRNLIDQSMNIMPNVEQNTDINESCTKESVQTCNADDVIESILSEQDINLLAANYEEQLHINNGNIPDRLAVTIDPDLYKAYTNVTPKQFIETIKQLDLNQLLLDHQKWHLASDNFLSLLNDITCCIKPENVGIFADCY